VTYTELVNAIQAYTENVFPDTYLAEGSAYTYVQQINTFIQQAEERIYNTVLIPALRKNVTGVVTSGNKYLSCPNDFLSAFSLAVIDNVGSYEYLLNKDVNFIRAAYPSPNDQAIPKYYALFGPTVSNGVPTTELSFIVGPTPDDDYSVELHYFYYPESIVQGVLTGVSITSGGSAYTDGVYYTVPLTSSAGAGTGALATVVVSSGAVTSVTLTSDGAQYHVGDVLTTSASEIGGTGLGLQLTVTSIANPTGTSWLGDNYSPVLLYGSLVEAYIFMKGEQDMLTAYQQKYNDALQQLIRLGGALERGDTYRDGQYKGKAAP
jgi:hypothetical protein